MKLQYSSSVPTVAAGEIIQGQCDVNGNLKVVIPAGSVTVEAGNKSNNGGVPGATNLGTLPAVANAAAPSYTETNQVALSTDLSGNARVSSTGNIASGATDSGNPVKVGGINMTTLPTFTDGQRGDLQIDTRGSLHVNLFNSNSNTAVNFSADNTDANSTSSTANAMKVRGMGNVFNGSTWDRMRGDTVGTFTKAGVGATSTNVYSVNNSFGTATKAAAKASTGNLFSVYCSNINAAVRYLQIHNKATAPAGTDVPVSSFLIPAGTATAPATIVLDASYFGTNGKYLSTGVSWAISTTNATFTDSATASEHNLEINYI